MISEVRAADVQQFWCDVRDGKTAEDGKAGPSSRLIICGGIGAATLGIRDLSAAYVIAIRQEWVAANPCSPVNKPADRRRTRFLSLADVQRLSDALDALEGEGASPRSVAILRLWALIGCCREEIAALKWSEIDFECGCLRLDDSKTGRSV